jgi:hypothetical protein
MYNKNGMSDDEREYSDIDNNQRTDHPDNGTIKNRNRKRRSKNDSNGRNHKCPKCGKSYLSQPALTNHIKTKHRNDCKTLIRSRGRPKKTVKYFLTIGRRTSSSK